MAVNGNLPSALCSSECRSSWSPISLLSLRVYALSYLNLPLYTWPFCTWHVLTTDCTVSAVRFIKRSRRLQSKRGSYNHDGVPQITWKWEPRDARIYGVCIFWRLPNEYTLGHCGLFAASRHSLASTSTHYSLLTSTWHDSTLLNSFAKKKQRRQTKMSI